MSIIDRADLDSGRVDLAAVGDGTSEPVGPIHPGEILRDWLEDIGLADTGLAAAIGVPITRIAAVLDGREGVNAELALRLGRHLGTSPEFWLTLQSRYELDVAGAQAASSSP